MTAPVEPPLTPGAGERPVKSSDAVLAALPVAMQREEDPVRDAIVDSHTALQFSYEERSEYALAQADLDRATDEYLDGLAEDRTFARSLNELDEDLRERIHTVPEVVTLEAIRNAVNAILANVTDKRCEVFEAATGRRFVRQASSTGSWHSFVASASQVAGPSYPSQYYSRDAPQNGGKFIPNSDPGGMWFFRGGQKRTVFQFGEFGLVNPATVSDSIGRMFVVRVPELSGVATTHARSAGSSGPSRWFVGSGASSVNTSFFSSTAVALTVYQAIENAVNRIVGHSMRWEMTSDSRL